MRTTIRILDKINFVKVIVTQPYLTLLALQLEPTSLFCPWNSPGKNTGVGCLFLLQGIFPTQGLNPGLLHCRWGLYHMSHQACLFFKKQLYTSYKDTLKSKCQRMLNYNQNNNGCSKIIKQGQTNKKDVEVKM